MDLYDILYENLSLWILQDQKIYNHVKDMLIENGNNLKTEKMLTEYLQNIDDICKEIGSLGIEHVVNKKFMEGLMEAMEIEIN